MSSPLTVFTVIRNGILNGYPFIENYGSWLPYCDRLFILDGCSTDGTDMVLARFAKLSPKVMVESAPWPATSIAGSSIADFTNEALRRVSASGHRLVYIQADEILSKSDRLRINEYQGPDPLRFNRYVIYWGSFHQILRLDEDAGGGAIRWLATRVLPPGIEARSIGDGLDLEVGDAVPVEIDVTVQHYGWNFPVNMLQKHINHSALYPDHPLYRMRGRIAARMLARHDFSPSAIDAIDPKYHSLRSPYQGEHPECVQHLLDADCYDPYVGLRQLESGAVW